MNLSMIVFDGALWVAVAVALAAGLISFVSPCVLPLVPGYFGYLTTSMTTSEGRDRGRGPLLLGVLLFIAGFTTVFMSVTILGGVFGLFFLEYSAVITRVLGVVVIAMGLAFLGVFRRAQRTVRPQARRNLGMVSAPLLGLALGVGWTPCIGPTLAAIMSVSWNMGDPSRAAVLGLAYSLGLGIPFLLLALGAGWATRSVSFVKRHIRVINIAGGTVMILLGIAMVTGVWGSLMSVLQGVMLNVTLPI
ncbi:cytochrome C biogenesis protein [Microbacterium sp. Gd 4-13]|uniref:cytochrome c biogenesis CcdA family protein n=1 Tax=Microbacterium sp. Gd 4-13 TaxID=2173179 RepID=UPI000D569BF9|nr:cytochrome c biogenesis protein CcdA [Microbacterium sp. Gd 4-13]PVW02020.1 cytochrome C biogenesis protein [Microbacterium sp. Gd 4-13]